MQKTETQKRVSPRKAAAVVASAKTEEKTAPKAPRKAVSVKAEKTVAAAKVEKKTGKVSPLAVAAGAVRKFFVFVEGARPTSGPRLAAHTNAALTFLGLADNRPAKKNAVLAVLGVRAVKYHRDIGNLVEVADTLKLSPKGMTFFSERVKSGKVDGNLNAAFLTAIQKGKTNEAAGIRDSHLIPVGMAV